MSDKADPRELMRRYSGNPILRPHDFPKMVNAVFNPGATVFEGRTLLLLRVEYRMGCLAGRRNERRRAHRLGDRPGPRASLDGRQLRRALGGRGSAHHQSGRRVLRGLRWVSAAGPLVLLATTRDFTRWERRGVLMSPEDKDAALFPTTFGGRWALIHRPAPSMAGFGADMWLSFSPDLRHWGDSQVLLPARRGGWWDANKVGLGPPPLLTKQGWLVCYHGVRVTASGSIYRLGLALLDRDDPTKMLARGNEWVLGPHEPYEQGGDVPDVIFSCGWVLRDDGDTLHLYYGAADTVVCVAETSLATLLDHLAQHPCKPESAGGPFMGTIGPP